MSDSKVLFITGAESFVGKRLLKHCTDLGVKYQGVDIVASEDPNISQMDICDTNLSRIIPEGAIVVHLAAISRDSDCAANPTLANKINIEGTLNLLRSAQKQNAGQLIFASSEWVYGQVSIDDEQRESDNLRIDLLDSVYAITKAVGEQYLRLLRNDTDVTVLRFGIIYGPRPSNWSAVESLYNSVKNQGEVVVGSLKAGRRFIHIDDICTGILAAVNRVGFEIFNLSGDSTVTLGQVIEESMRIHGTSPRVIESSPEKISLRNPSNEKAKQILGWSPKVSISAGLKSL
jgi:nucleoside-diphosphate-sugar epimerase